MACLSIFRNTFPRVASVGSGNSITKGSRPVDASVGVHENKNSFVSNNLEPAVRTCQSEVSRIFSLSGKNNKDGEPCWTSTESDFFPYGNFPMDLNLNL